MIVRCTAKLVKLLGTSTAEGRTDPTADDWYANLVWMDRRKCILLVHAGTLFPIVAVDVRKGDVLLPGPFFVELIRAALREERLPPTTFGELDPNDVAIRATASRSVLAHMNQMVQEWRFLAADRVDVTHPAVINHRLRRTLVARGNEYRQPLELLAEHLAGAK